MVELNHYLIGEREMMIDNLDFVLYGAIVGVVTLVTGVSYKIFRKARAHSAEHKPEVMNKINDFFGTQDANHSN